jgi:hypothetical protein
MKKYEYKHFNCRLGQSELNALGNQGWKLVSHTALVAGGSGVQYYVFIREIE